MKNFKNMNTFNNNDLTHALLLELNNLDSDSQIIIETLENSVNVDLSSFTDLYTAVDSLISVNDCVYDSETELVELFEEAEFTDLCDTDYFDYFDYFTSKN